MRVLAVALLLVSATADAHPGGHHLTCTSEKGAKQSVQLDLSRMNGVGWAGPSFTITVDGTAHEFTTDDEMQSFGSTTHDSPHGVIVVTADNRADTAATEHGGFTVKAIKRSVKAYDVDGKRVRSSAAATDDDGCYDSNGKATFRARFRGWIGGDKLDAQILDCELDYDSGMAC